MSRTAADKSQELAQETAWVAHRPRSQTEVSVRDDIYSLFESWDLDLPEDLNDHTALFDSGLFDSLALFNLASWIENRSGHAIDPAQFDLRREWATINDIVHFIERGQDSDPAHDQRGAESAPHPAPNDGYRIEKYRPEFKARVARLQT